MAPWPLQKTKFRRIDCMIRKVSFDLKLNSILSDIVNCPPLFSELKYIENLPNYCVRLKIYPPVAPWPLQKTNFFRINCVIQKVRTALKIEKLLCDIVNCLILFLEWKFVKISSNYCVFPNILPQIAPWPPKITKFFGENFIILKVRTS